MRIQVTREATDRMSQEVWEFNVIGDYPNMRLILDHYTSDTRQSTRQRYKAIRFYSRLHTRQFSNMPYTDVPLPADIQSEAKRLFCESVQVTI